MDEGMGCTCMYVVVSYVGWGAGGARGKEIWGAVGCVSVYITVVYTLACVG